MAISKCAKCGSGYFELVEKEPANSQYKMFFVQCSSCGIPVGVADYFNSGALLKEQEEKLEEMSSQLNNIESYLNRILRSLK